MPRIHPKSGLLDGLTGLLPEARRRILHHLDGCPACQAQARPQVKTEERVLQWRPRESDYGAVVDRVLRAFRPRFAAAELEEQAAPGLLAELLDLPAGRRELLLRNSRRFQSPALCQYVLRRSREVTPGDPPRGEELASLAMQIIERLDPSRVDAERSEDLRAWGWMRLANARRARADLHGAEAALVRAETHLKQGSGDLAERANLLVVKAGLRREKGRFGEASRLLRRALSIWLTLGEARRATEALLSWALVCRMATEPGEGQFLLDQAMALAGPAPEPRLRLILHHNLAACLVDEGRFLEAQAILGRLSDLYRTVSDPLVDLRLQWLRAEITRGLGRFPEAADLFVAVRDGFLEKGNGYEASLLSIELAQTHAGMGRFADAEESARAALEVFRSLGIEREALGALALLHQAAARRTAVSRAS